MKERTQTGGQAISGLFTMLLFLVFVLCALFSVLMGSRVYENITKRSDENFSGTTALSYIANKIRQGDREDAVDIIEVDGTPVLQLKQKVGDEMYHNVNRIKEHISYFQPKRNIVCTTIARNLHWCTITHCPSYNKNNS